MSNNQNNPHLPGGMPNQSQLLTDRAVFTDAYAFMPKGVMRDIVTSSLPHWDKTRLWVLARPLSGFAETFSQYLMEIMPDGGSTNPEDDDNAQCVIYVIEGSATLTIDGNVHNVAEGDYAYIPPATKWEFYNNSTQKTLFHWIRKAYEKVEGISPAEAFVINEGTIEPDPMPLTKGCWSTTRFVDRNDMRHDMHVNIVNFDPGAVIPFAETHVMEHGIYILEGKGVYRLNQDWVEVEAGDFMWLRAFCPQACYAGGPGKFRYLLYKNVNRQMKLT